MISNQRELFDIPDDVTYFNCAYMGPVPKAALDVGAEAMNRKRWPWTVFPPDFFTELEQVRGLFARLTNCQPDDVAQIPAVSYGTGVAAANLPVKAGQKILVLQDQFPSNVYPWMVLAKKKGAELVTIPGLPTLIGPGIFWPPWMSAPPSRPCPSAIGPTEAWWIWPRWAGAAGSLEQGWWWTEPRVWAPCPLTSRRYSQIFWWWRPISGCWDLTAWAICTQRPNGSRASLGGKLDQPGRCRELCGSGGI
jgi:hypothetical protein